MILEPYRPRVPEPQAPPPRVTGPTAYVSNRPWVGTVPSTLVIACSDGRIQASMDDFLENSLGVRIYDRLYLPGGPGGLAGGAAEYSRAAQMLSECRFLVTAHEIDRVILIFHGAQDDGPEEAVCGDYLRKHGARARIPEMQATDLRELLRGFRAGSAMPRSEAYRAEVDADGRVVFTLMAAPS